MNILNYINKIINSPIMIEVISGIITAVVTIIILGGYNSFGKLKIYARKRYNCKIDKLNGVDNIMIEVAIDCYNSSRKDRIMRGLNLELFNNSQHILDMVPIDRFGDVVYTESGYYSFVIPASNIKSTICFFFIKIEDNIKFDEIKFSYYNNKDKKVYLSNSNLFFGEDKNINLDLDREWHELKNKK